MKITNLVEDIKKLKANNQQLGSEKNSLQTQLATLTKTKDLDYDNLSQKINRLRQMAAVRLIEKAFLNKKKINLTYELAKAENTIINLGEDKQNLSRTNTDLEQQINDLETELNNTSINQEEFAKKLLVLNQYLTRPTSLAEKLTIPASD